MQPQILLAVADEERRIIYEAFVKNAHVICQTVSSLRDVATQTVKQPYSAVFIDMPLFITASRYEKSLVQDTLNSIPYARLNITPKTGKIRMLVSWETHKSPLTPEEHLRFCCERPLKIILPRNRTPLNLNALLSQSSDMESAERTVCIDISSGGCFLFCVNDEFKVKSHVWIRLLNLNDPSPIKSTVCWKQEWGLTDKIPGIGIRFDDMTGLQYIKLISLCGGK